MRYRSVISDSARWEGFEFRPGDIVISTSPKCGTTWTQMLCALLIFDGPDFPQPLERLSPWLDMQNRRIDDVRADYAAQRHRRFIKTHTPLDGLPQRDDVTYLVVGRDPRDVAISMEHHVANMDYHHFMELRAAAVGTEDLGDFPPRPTPSDDPAERFRAFIIGTAIAGPTNLSMVLDGLRLAWERRTEPNIAMFHYSDFRADLVGEMCRLARALGITLSESRAAELAPEASIGRMRERAADLAPSASLGNWKSVEGFFRSGEPGEWRERVTDADLRAYEERVASLVPADLAKWAHLGRAGSGVNPNAEKSTPEATQSYR